MPPSVVCVSATLSDASLSAAVVSATAASFVYAASFVSAAALLSAAALPAVLLLPHPANADTAKTPAKIVVSTLFLII